MLDNLKNFLLIAKEKISMYDFLIFPILAATSYIFWHNKLTVDSQLLDKFINITSVFLGFLITIHSIIIALPKENKFFKSLIEYGYFKQMYINILMGEVFLLTCLMFSLFGVCVKITPILLILGLINTILLSKTFFKISFYS